MGVLADGGFYNAILGEARLVARRARTAAVDNATTRLRVRSGRLRSSIASAVDAKPGSIAIVLSAGGTAGGEPVKYAALQEFGDTITPKRGKYLAIPIGPAKTAAGVARRPGPRDYGDQLRFRPISGGRGLLVDRAGGEAYFVLVRSVTIPPTYYLRDAFVEAARHASVRLLSVGVEALEV